MNCRLETGEPYDEIHTLFRTELDRTHPRSEVRLEDDDGKAVFVIEAEDVTAFRAAMNGITGILKVNADGRRIIEESPRA